MHESANGSHGIFFAPCRDDLDAVATADGEHIFIPTGSEVAKRENFTVVREGRRTGETMLQQRDRYHGGIFVAVHKLAVNHGTDERVIFTIFLDLFGNPCRRDVRTIKRGDGVLTKKLSTRMERLKEKPAATAR